MDGAPSPSLSGSGTDPDGQPVGVSETAARPPRPSGRELWDCAEAVARFRAGLGEEQNASLSDRDCRRFLRSERGHVGRALGRQAKNWAWRESFFRGRPPSLHSCATCERDARSHYMHLVGRDIAGCPVIYSTYRHARGAMNAEENVDHMVECFETAVELMEEDEEGGFGVEQWVWVADFVGFGMKHTSPGTALAANDLFSLHYPERLKGFIGIQAPGIFSALWSAIRWTLDPVTAQKISFCQSQRPDRLKEQLMDKGLGDELAGWIVAEVLDNRRRGPKDPKYFRGNRVLPCADPRALLCSDEAMDRVDMGGDQKGGPEGAGHGPEPELGPPQAEVEAPTQSAYVAEPWELDAPGHNHQACPSFIREITRRDMDAEWSKDIWI